MGYRDNFSWAKRFRRVNRWVQVVLMVSLLIGLNFLSSGLFLRRDLSPDSTFSLRPESRAIVRSIEAPIDVVVTLTEQADKRIFRDIQRLLSEYSYLSQSEGRHPIRIEYVDLFKQRQRAQELMVQYGLNVENAILFVSRERRHRVDVKRLYALNEDGQIVGFRGEEVFTSAVREVSLKRRPRVYFLQGQGEMQLDHVDPLRGLSRLREVLMERGFDLATLDTATISAIPSDADAVVTVGPQVPFSGRAEEMLRRYLEDRGVVVAALAPGVAHGLDDLFFEWGLLVDDRLIVERSPSSIVAGGDFLVRRFSREHPVTQFLIENQLGILVGGARPVRVNPGSPLDASLRLTALMASSEQSWGERSYRIGPPYEFDPQVDLAGPVTLATVVERTVGNDLGLSLASGRIVVVGSADLLANGRLDSFGNRIFGASLFGWAVERDSYLSIPPRAIREFRLVASQSQMMGLLMALLIVPASMAGLGIIIILLRRF